MRILVLHSDVAPDAPLDEQDTLYAAEEIAKALTRCGHHVSKAAFSQDQDRFDRILAEARADVVFNMVEGVNGSGVLAPIAPRMLDEAGVIYTGADAVSMAVTSDKPATKRRLREAGIATPDWSVPPDWKGLRDKKYIVKHTLEDASVGLDDECIVTGADAVKKRAELSRLRFGGDWFAEEFVDGREFNIAVLEGRDGPVVMPMAEMVFENWNDSQPRIVGWRAKWHEESHESDQTVRYFGVETKEPVLAAKLKAACEGCWKTFDLTGYCRVDFRVTPEGEPTVLEINTNPGISPDAGLPAAALEAGMNYDQFLSRLVEIAHYRAP
ncbi:MAG: ATP-grasp domain-containing protein [Alphaproteobacteria bacterium]|nr:ATP-grasp domain-containing protein [Alphaproteobacteria bacterium]